MIWKRNFITKICLLSVSAGVEMRPFKTFHVWEEGRRLRFVRKPEQPEAWDMCTGCTMQRHHCSICCAVFWPGISSWPWETSSVTVYRGTLWFNVATFKKRVKTSLLTLIQWYLLLTCLVAPSHFLALTVHVHPARWSWAKANDSCLHDRGF